VVHHQLLERDQQLLVAGDDDPCLAHQLGKCTIVAHDRSHAVGHRFEHHGRVPLHPGLGAAGRRHDHVDVTPECHDLVPRDWAEPADAGSEPELLGQVLERFLLRAGPRDKQRPRSHELAAGAEQAIDAALRHQSAHGCHGECFGRRPIRHWGRHDALLRQGHRGDVRRRLGEDVLRESIPPDDPAHLAQGAAVAPLLEVPALLRETFPGKDHGWDLELERLVDYGRGALGSGLELDVHERGPEIGQQAFEGAGLVLQGVRKFDGAGDGDR
jgi:hypothetical protein